MARVNLVRDQDSRGLRGQGLRCVWSWVSLSDGQIPGCPCRPDETPHLRTQGCPFSGNCHVGLATNRTVVGVMSADFWAAGWLLLGTQNPGGLSVMVAARRVGREALRGRWSWGAALPGASAVQRPSPWWPQGLAGLCLCLESSNLRLVVFSFEDRTDEPGGPPGAPEA